MTAKKNTPATIVLTLAVASYNGEVNKGQTNIAHLYREVPSAYYAAYREALREAVASLEPGDKGLKVTYVLPKIEVVK